MIITKEGSIVVAVGEVIAYKGRVFGCKASDSTVRCGLCAFNEDDKVCDLMECRLGMRDDGLNVIFKPFGEMEGGEE